MSAEDKYFDGHGSKKERLRKNKERNRRNRHKYNEFLSGRDYDDLESVEEDFYNFDDDDFEKFHHERRK